MKFLQKGGDVPTICVSSLLIFFILAKWWYGGISIYIRAWFEKKITPSLYQTMYLRIIEFRSSPKTFKHLDFEVYILWGWQSAKLKICTECLPYSLFSDSWNSKILILQNITISRDFSLCKCTTWFSGISLLEGDKTVVTL